MILAWLASATALGAVIALGGSSVMGLVARVGLPRRWTALALMLVTVALPVALALRAPAAVAATASDVHVSAPTFAITKETAPAASPSHRVDFLLLFVWGTLSLAIGGTFAASHRRLRGEVATLPLRELYGRTVAMSDDLGPAAVGLLRPAVVLPAWVFELPIGEQELVLRHEYEHVRARDHAVLFSGIVLVVLMPWSVGLWWQLRRLRVAVELDCDARVTPVPRDRPRYAELLLRSRDRAPARRMALAFASTRSALAERLLALLDGGRPSGRRVAGWSVSTAACALIGLRVPVPTLVSLIPAAVVASKTLQPHALPIGAAFSNPVEYALPSGKGAPKRAAAGRAVAAPILAPVREEAVRAAPHDSAAAVPARQVRYDSLVPYVLPSPSVSRRYRVSTMARGTPPMSVMRKIDSTSPINPDN